MTDSDCQELKFCKGFTDDETLLFDDKDEQAEEIPWVFTDDDEDDESTDIENTDDERTKLDNDDHEMTDAVKTDAGTLVEENANKVYEENVEKIEEKKVDEK
uniref:Uncharacterized protein n=1 Tax=Tanacetum cinerariifolium TaxID=118510 RepID=A0A6L2KDF4_TANCI|nr:hypothetical protein [Tanacetum cinerariifolium]